MLHKKELQNDVGRRGRRYNRIIPVKRGGGTEGDGRTERKSSGVKGPSDGKEIIALSWRMVK